MEHAWPWINTCDGSRGRSRALLPRARSARLAHGNHDGEDGCVAAWSRHPHGHGQKAAGLERIATHHNVTSRLGGLQKSTSPRLPLTRAILSRVHRDRRRQPHFAWSNRQSKGVGSRHDRDRSSQSPRISETSPLLSDIVFHPPSVTQDSPGGGAEGGQCDRSRTLGAGRATGIMRH